MRITLEKIESWKQEGIEAFETGHTEDDCPYGDLHDWDDPYAKLNRGNISTSIARRNWLVGFRGQNTISADAARSWTDEYLASDLPKPGVTWVPLPPIKYVCGSHPEVELDYDKPFNCELCAEEFAENRPEGMKRYSTKMIRKDYYGTITVTIPTGKADE